MLRMAQSIKNIFYSWEGNMNYGEAIEKAWKIIWRCKILWVFGLLASLASGVNITPNFNFQFDARNYVSGYPFARLSDFLGSITILGWSLIALALFVLILIAAVIATIGIGGVRRGAWLVDAGAGSLAFGALLRESAGYFWRVFGLTLLLGLPGVVFTLISAVAFIASIGGMVYGNAPQLSVVLVCLAIPLCCLILPLFWLIGILWELAVVALVGENLGVFASIGRGWEVLRRKLGNVLVMALLLLVLRFVVGIVVGIPAALLTIPVVLAVLAAQNTFVLGIGVIVLLIVLVPLGLLASSIQQAYTGSLWTVTFRRLTASLAAVPAAPVFPPAPAPTDFPPA
jgi:hypothetical protein